MNCDDFERLWNVRLDARGEPDAALEHRLDEHAAGCAACRALAARYRLLTQAIARVPGLAPSAGFTERCLAEVSRGYAAPRARATRPWHYAVRLAAAACLLAAVAVGFYRAWDREEPKVVAAPPEPRALPDALADATSATWDLALEASAPAARIGREVLGSAVEPVSSESRNWLPATAETASDMLHNVGERVNEGVRPLSGSARHAFGFLLGPALDDADGSRPS